MFVIVCVFLKMFIKRNVFKKMVICSYPESDAFFWPDPLQGFNLIFQAGSDSCSQARLGLLRLFFSAV